MATLTVVFFQLIAAREDLECSSSWAIFDENLPPQFLHLWYLNSGKTKADKIKKDPRDTGQGV